MISSLTKLIANPIILLKTLGKTEILSFHFNNFDSMQCTFTEYTVAADISLANVNETTPEITIFNIRFYFELS